MLVRESTGGDVVDVSRERIDSKLLGAVPLGVEVGVLLGVAEDLAAIGPA